MQNLQIENSEQLLTRAEVASFLDVDPSTLSRWHQRGIGPPVLKLSDQIHRYQKSDVMAYLAKLRNDFSK